MTHGAVVALAGWLVSFAPMDPKLSVPAATAILVAIMRATKGSFCQMAAEDAKRLIAARAK